MSTQNSPVKHHRKWPWVVGLLVVVGIGAAAGANKGSEPAEPAVIESVTSDRPQPTDAQVRQIALRLAAIQPEMAELTVDQVGRWADATCDAVWTGGSDVTAATKARFAGGSRPPLTDEQARGIVLAVTEVYCH